MFFGYKCQAFLNTINDGRQAFLATKFYIIISFFLEGLYFITDFYLHFCYSNSNRMQTHILKNEPTCNPNPNANSNISSQTNN